ncbi:LPXTG cell wall anchor domain-containing protein [Enterococcus florum]|nr:LPXTG cell wall anchor domain-containing protein [Enterococcus florum]
MILVGLLALTFPYAAHAETSTTPQSAIQMAAEETISSETAETAARTESTTDSSQTENSTAASSSQVAEKESTNELTKKETEQLQKEIVEKVEKDLDTKATKPEPSMDYTADEIRQNLYAITGNKYSKADFDRYSDEELLNTQTLFLRYNLDTVGMDAGGFARLLEALYKDKTISYAEAEKALSFNPRNYTSCLDMINDIDQLQAYLRAMYPSNSSFMPIRNLTNDELIAILKKIAPFEDKMVTENGHLFPGIALLISNYASDSAKTTDDSKDDQQNMNAGNETANQTPANSTPASSEEKSIVQSILPKTGEQKMMYLTVLGVVLIVLVAFIFIKRTRTSSK